MSANLKSECREARAAKIYLISFRLPVEILDEHDVGVGLIVLGEENPSMIRRD
jgi:hypothetical protein